VLSTVTYPDGRVIHYNYSSFLDADLSRPSSISDGGSTPYATFSYLGASTIMGEARPSVGLGYSLLVSGGLDALGRVTDLRWTLGSAVADEFAYGYDASGNRMWRDVRAATGSADVYDEVYDYDGLNRLTLSERGTRYWDDETQTWQFAPAGLSQSWSLDALGNWDGFTSGTSTQTRSENDANEITSATGWITPQYGAAGNMTVAPKPGAEATTGFTLTYDAWNRLVKVQQWTDTNGNHQRDTGESASLVA
jgi:hypothetical protein